MTYQPSHSTMTEAETKLQSNLEWYQTGRLAPYLVEARAPEGSEITMFEARQPAGDVSDPPLCDLVLTHCLGSFPFTSDLGAGRFTGRSLGDQFVVVPPRVATSIMVDAPHRIRSLNISAKSACRWLGRDENDPLDFGALHAQINHDPYVNQTLHALWRELSREDQTSRLFVESAVTALLWRLNQLAEAAAAPELARGGLAPWQVRRVTEFMAAHLAQDLSLGELADLANLSPYHFARAFKKSVGLPPYRYQVRLRVEKACALLRETNLTVAEIADIIGYDTPQAFARMFRRQMGVCPSEYRRETTE